jgi:hypothetical protein
MCGQEVIQAAAILRALNTPPQSSSAASTSSPPPRRPSGLVHASCCEDPECTVPDCERLKQVLDHAYWCPRAVSSCAVCRRVWTMQETHSAACVTPGCPVLSCRLMSRNKKYGTVV